MDHKQIILLLWYFTGTKTSSQHRENNVCKNFQDFQNIQYSPNCWYNPDVYAAPETIARNHGYQFQSHTLQTEDGYNLTMFRIQDRFSDSQKQPILLLHGLFGSAVYFMSSGNMSLAFYLARNGYDVWLANHRGNSFSEGHTKLKMTDKHFWDFSFHEIALYDIPSVVEYISEATGNFTKLIYVGHSMGTTIGFLYASLKKNHAEQYMKGYIALCPVTAMRHSAFQTIGPAVDIILQGVLANNIFVLFSDTRQVSKQVTSYCMEHAEFCLTILSVAQGEDQGEYIPEHLVVALSHYPERTSVKCVAHYFQMITSGRFQQYDYGVLENLRRYNSEIPPLYSLSEISIPVHLFYGLNDKLAAYEDVLWTFGELKTARKSMTLVPGSSTVRYNHFDFLFSKNIKAYFYESLMPILKELE